MLQSTLIDALERAPAVLTQSAHDGLVKAWQTQALWKLYKVAAKSVGLDVALAARQFKAEYAVIPDGQLTGSTDVRQQMEGRSAPRRARLK